MSSPETERSVTCGGCSLLCDDLTAVSPRSLNAVGETMMAFLSDL